ncbi:hypothetical protein B2G74_18555 [Burkholderia sp. A27]|nr:hypothetical protein B2G74_18555 [Burkholderia sp. A27]
MDQTRFNQICNEFTKIKDKSEFSLVIKLISDEVQGSLKEKQEFVLRTSQQGADSTVTYHSPGNGELFSWTGTLASTPAALELFVLSD